MTEKKKTKEVTPREELQTITLTLPKSLVEYIEMIARTEYQPSRSWVVRKIIGDHKKEREAKK